MKKKLIILSSSILSFMPMMALAQADPGTIEEKVNVIGNILGYVIPVIIILGVIYFIWGVVQYVISDDEEAKKAGKNRMIFGIIGLVVIVGMWGLVGIVTKSFGIDGTGSPAIDVYPKYE
ncbi:MAG: pilin [Candidatus Paceibacterota bacterium]